MHHPKKIAILGFARDAAPIIGVLRRRAESRGAEIWILDRNPALKVPSGIRAHLGKDYLSGLDAFDLIFRTPGIPYRTPELQRAIARGTVVSSSTKLFFEEIAGLPARSRPVIVGITGTKGKSTTATLLYKMLIAAGRRAYLGGNIGISPLAILPKLRRTAGTRDRDGRAPSRPVVVLEMSSFQLQDLDASPDIAVVLAMFPDHQDLHRSLKEYYDAKANIVRHQRPGGVVYYFPDNRVTARTALRGPARRRIAVAGDGFTLFGQKDIALPGRHNFMNAVMAARVAQHLGVPDAAVARTVKRFKGLPHRLQFVRALRGVRFYNDSASHNPSAAAAAVRAFSGSPAVLIAGGKDRHIDFAPLAGAAKEHGHIVRIVVYGENKDKVRTALGRAKVPVAVAATLRSAVLEAYRAAKAAGTGTVVLFSPGSASFDMYRDYEARGEDFVRIVTSLRS